MSTCEQQFRFVVTQEVVVTLDVEMFDEPFMREFRERFYDFDTIEEHAEHIAQLQARGLIDIEVIPEFIEGYGPSDSMGIKTKVGRTEIEQVQP